MPNEKVVSKIVADIFQKKDDWRRKGLRWAKHTDESDLLFHLLPSKIVGSNIRPRYYPEIYVSYHRFRAKIANKSNNLFHEFDQYQVSLRLSSLNLCSRKLQYIDSKDFDLIGAQRSEDESFYDEGSAIDYSVRISRINSDFKDQYFDVIDKLSRIDSMIELYAKRFIPVYSLAYPNVAKWSQLLRVNKDALLIYADWMEKKSSVS